MAIFVGKILNEVTAVANYTNITFCFSCLKLVKTFVETNIKNILLSTTVYFISRQCH